MENHGIGGSDMGEGKMFFFSYFSLCVEGMFKAKHFWTHYDVDSRSSSNTTDEEFA